MTVRTSRRLLDGAVIGLYEVACSAPASPAAEEEHATTTEVIVPLAGCFEVHRRGDTTVTDPASAVVLFAGDDYRVAHPADGGDRCFVFVLPGPSADEVARRTGTRAHVVDPSVQMRIHRARIGLRDGVLDPLEAEEGATHLLDAIVTGADHGPPVGRASRNAVEAARALLASRPGVRWRLDAVAREVFVSPAHLARRFRAVTGESMARYLMRLRLGLALDRLADGESDLAALAADLGFASHSHFTARFRATFGETPSAFRRSLDRDRRAELRTIVTAPARSAS